ncbi:MAG: flagellar assembly peptidoglycan hydrolase FlgJ [Gammaproteobacteria bacterium]|nr:MAG: flagellar assembly peptidoglycan hydrolase FlgJ [Gammaproteobacteria bacterium]
MNIFTQTEQISPSIYSDNSSLDRIRQKGLTDTPAAIKAAAKEFESFFMNMMLKSMRQASEVMGEDSMFSSPQEKMFVGMLDEQMSVELSQKGSLGIADLITRNLTPKTSLGFDLSANRAIQNAQVKNSPSVNDAILSEIIPKKSPVVDGLITKILNVKKIDLNQHQTNKVIELDETVNIAPTKSSMFDSISSFVDQLMPLAQKAASKIGLDPKILLAQAALETGWGKHVIHDSEGKPSFNLFGIKDSKSWQGESVQINTLEVESGELVKRKADFRSYSSFEKSFEDFISFISENPRYEKAIEFVDDAKQFIRSIQDAGYATDPQYANKIINIFNRNLTK